MANNIPLDYTYENSGNSKLYSFLATNYSISNLANNISAENNMKKGLLSLRNMINSNDIANA